MESTKGIIRELESFQKQLSNGELKNQNYVGHYITKAVTHIEDLENQRVKTESDINNIVSSYCELLKEVDNLTYNLHKDPDLQIEISIACIKIRQKCNNVSKHLLNINK